MATSKVFGKRVFLSGPPFDLAILFSNSVKFVQCQELVSCTGIMLTTSNNNMHYSIVCHVEITLGRRLRNFRNSGQVVFISYVMWISIGACLVTAVIPTGTLGLSSIQSTSTESSPNMVAIFFKYSLVANLKLASTCFFSQIVFGTSNFYEKRQQFQVQSRLAQFIAILH